MDEKTLLTLEYPKILERLTGYCAFEASAEKARGLTPSGDLILARQWLAETRESIQLQLKNPSLTIGGARDVRAAVDLAQHGGVLTPQELLDIKYTLVSARTLARTFERIPDQYPHLFEIINRLPPPIKLIDAITRAISDHGEILDSASTKLENIRRDMRISHDRLLAKLQRMVADPKNTPYLQEALITQRDGRYVIPLRSEFKGKVRSIVHDQSASGATLFVEPLAVVELNNKYRELVLAERDEERRILAELSSQAGIHGSAILTTVDVIADMDLALARGKFALDMRASEPELSPIVPKGNHPGTIIRLYQARHPLLDPKSVVPIDVELDPQTFALIVTGPNTGGKTVSLKTIGLLALMAQSGFFIPVHSGSTISLFDQIFADIGDEQSIEQSLSTFSGHITNIIRILEKADKHSLVILDELGAGTDPTEGAALARAIMSAILQRGITTLVTTHHPELKSFAHATPGVVNASVEFDIESLKPTYHLTIGLPGRSNALAIAQRLGMPAEIIDDARSELSPEDIRAEDLLNEIHHQRDLIRTAREAVDKARLEAEGYRAELVRRLDVIEEERQAILEQTRSEAEVEIRQLRDEIALVKRSLVNTHLPPEALAPIIEQVEILEEKIEQPIERLLPEVRKIDNRPIQAGDRVRLRTLGSLGILTTISGEDAEVQVGVLRVRTKLADLEMASGRSTAVVQPGKQAGKPPISRMDLPVENVTRPTTGFLAESPGVELDIRGKRADDALEELDKYLDSAFYAGLPFVRIIHGKGTGRLREVVREVLNQHYHVKSFESGGEKEGGLGVTVVKLNA